MKMSKLAPVALCAMITACSGASTTDAEATQPAADVSNAAAQPADAASQTQAVYGDEAPVAIQADQAKAEDAHAHNEDGSHPEGVEHADEAKAEGDHPHEPGQEAHDH